MPLADPPELFKMVPLYTAEGVLYGQTLERWDKQGVLFFSTTPSSISNAVKLMKEIEEMEDNQFHQDLGEAMDPNR